METNLLGRARQRTSGRLRERLPDARQGEVGPKWASLDLEAELLAGDLEIVMQQFQPCLRRDTQPYDTSPPKVRERTDSLELHNELTVASRDAVEGPLQLAYHLGRLLAKKLQCEMNEGLANPGELRRRLAERLDGGHDLASSLGWKVNRDEQPHRGRDGEQLTR